MWHRFITVTIEKYISQPTMYEIFNFCNKNNNKMATIAKIDQNIVHTNTCAYILLRV